MEFPFKPTAVSHRHGGTITEITGIGHVIDKPEDGRSRDYWFFLGRVKWNDGSGDGKTHEIAPFHLCEDGEAGHAEVSQLLEALMEYLAKHGKWHHDGKTKHEGWYATKRKA